MTPPYAPSHMNPSPVLHGWEIPTGSEFSVPSLPPNQHEQWLLFPVGEAEEEYDGEDEAKQAALASCISRTVNRNFAQHGHFQRGSHVKSIGFVRGSLVVRVNLPDHLRHGLFTTPGRIYPVGARYASESSHIEDDKNMGVRGLGMKVFDVEGTSIGGERASTQDLFFNNTPISELANLTIALEIFTLREKFWDDPEGLRQALLARKDANLQLHPQTNIPNTHLAADTLYSQSPYRFGPYMCKFSLLPFSRAQISLKRALPLPHQAEFSAHRKLLRAYCHQYPLRYILRAQFATDAQRHPIDDASVEWDAAWIDLADLTFPVQETWSDARRVWWEDRIALSPWHGLEDHRPLGSLGRARRKAYEISRLKREMGNDVVVKLAVGVNEMPD